MEEKFMELLNDQEFAEKLMALDEAADVQALLKDNGVELSLEDIETLRKSLNTQLSSAEGELDEDALEGVAGGVSLRTIIRLPSLPGMPSLPGKPWNPIFRVKPSKRW